MRYVVLFGITLISTLLQGAVFAQMGLLGGQPDLMLAVMVALVMAESTLTPVLYFSAGALVLDVLTGNAIGIYSLPYTMTGLFVYFAYMRRPCQKVPQALVVGGAAWACKDLLCAVTALIARNRFDFIAGLLHSTLPGIPIMAVLTFAALFLLRRLCQKPFMRPATAFPAKDGF